jgi:enolase
MTFRITHVDALEILDSRGRPTLQVTVVLDDGSRGVAGVPAGASLGNWEAVERRDGDPDRYHGMGVTEAVATVRGPVAAALTGRKQEVLDEIDTVLRGLDGTGMLRHLGGNTIIGTSLACARALAAREGQPLWQWLATASVPPRLPVPHLAMLNGGEHADNRLDVQEFMIAPLGAPSYPLALRAGAEIYATLGGLLRDRGLHTGLGDGGGYAPDLADEAQALDLLMETITRAGYTPGHDGVAIALDVAATGAYREGTYHLGGRERTTAQMIDWYAELVERYPICSIEDGLTDNDWDGWIDLTAKLGDRVQLVGDDLFVTDPATIAEGAGRRAGNAVLIKPNQVGTVTDTLEAIDAARRAGFAQMVSHRCGETTDTFIADLAVGCGCGQLKAGAPARGERVAKYNRLLEIAAAAPDLPYGPAPHHETA